MSRSACLASVFVGSSVSLLVSLLANGCVVTQLLGHDLPEDGEAPTTDTPDADAPDPDDAEASSPPIAVSALATGGGYHTCARLSNGAVKCWGLNDYGQLGLGDTQSRGDSPDEMGANLPEVDLGSGQRAKSITVGVRHTCAILEDNRVKCWGHNDHGQLGLGDTQSRGDSPGEMGDKLPYVDLGEGRTAIAVAAGALHTCALLDNRRVRCWGGNRGGQLGLGDTISRGVSPEQMGEALPYVDVGAVSVSELSVGAYHACVLVVGRVKCWGDNASGQLGIGDRLRRGDHLGEMGDALPFLDFPAFTVPTAVRLGGDISCAIFAKDVRCWGMNTQGQAGIGTTLYDPGAQPGEMKTLPVVSLGAGRAVSEVSVGGGHACALLDDGTVKCWGYNDSGQLGAGDTRERGGSATDMGDSLPIVPLGTRRRAVSIASYAEHTCALLDDRSVKCWGTNFEGQLGQGDRTYRGNRPGTLGDDLPAVRLVGP